MFPPCQKLRAGPRAEDNIDVEKSKTAYIGNVTALFFFFSPKLPFGMFTVMDILIMD